MVGSHQRILDILNKHFPNGAFTSEIIEKAGPPYGYAESTLRAEISYMKKLGLIEEIERKGRQMKVRAVVK